MIMPGRRNMTTSAMTNASMAALHCITGALEPRRVRGRPWALRRRGR